MIVDERSRSYEDTKEYKAVKKRILNYEAYLQCKLFSTHTPYVILKNKYPYTDKHYLFWLNPKYEKFYSFTRIKSVVYTHFPFSHVQRIFENKIYKRSIHTIRHIHIILNFPLLDPP